VNACERRYRKYKDIAMLTRSDIIEKALELGFEDVGVTTAEPFGAQLEYLRDHQQEYGWTEKVGLGLMTGTDPKAVMPSAQSIIVLMEDYFREAFPSALEGYFGRCYLDDDRVTKDGLAVRIKAFRSFLRENGHEAYGCCECEGEFVWHTGLFQS